jgi:type I restriction enzyme S subunit
MVALSRVRQYCGDGVKLLRPGNLHVSGRVQWNEENKRCMPERWEQENPDLVVGPSELVMNLTAQSLRDEFLGRICITSADEHCLLNQRLAKLTPILVHRSIGRREPLPTSVRGGDQ